MLLFNAGFEFDTDKLEKGESISMNVVPHFEDWPELYCSFMATNQNLTIE